MRKPPTGPARREYGADVAGGEVFSRQLAGLRQRQENDTSRGREVEDSTERCNHCVFSLSSLLYAVAHSGANPATVRLAAQLSSAVTTVCSFMSLRV